MLQLCSVMITSISCCFRLKVPESSSIHWRDLIPMIKMDITSVSAAPFWWQLDLRKSLREIYFASSRNVAGWCFIYACAVTNNTLWMKVKMMSLYKSYSWNISDVATHVHLSLCTSTRVHAHISTYSHNTTTPPPNTPRHVHKCVLICLWHLNTCNAHVCFDVRCF